MKSLVYKLIKLISLLLFFCFFCFFKYFLVCLVFLVVVSNTRDRPISVILSLPNKLSWTFFTWLQALFINNTRSLSSNEAGTWCFFSLQSHTHNRLLWKWIHRYFSCFWRGVSFPETDGWAALLAYLFISCSQPRQFFLIMFGIVEVNLMLFWYKQTDNFLRQNISMSSKHLHHAFNIFLFFLFF